MIRVMRCGVMLARREIVSGFGVPYVGALNRLLFL
jgi:hypothetical protein